MNEFQKIRHFVDRMGFGIDPLQYSEFRKMAKQEVMVQYFNSAPRKLVYTNQAETPTMQPQSQEEFQKQQQKNIRATGKIRASWLQRMIQGSEPLIERVSLFWHGHFACRILHPGLAVQYLNVFRTHGLGHFKDLVMAIAKNPAMIRYLNNQQNRKGSPNENFTRELLELFTLGRGNYSERDIKEGARAFTGWSSNRQGEYVFRPFFHDYEQKVFLGEEGHFDGEDIIDIILSKKESAFFLARAMLEYFVGRDVMADHVHEVADVLWSNNLHINDTLKYIATSDWFYDTSYVGNKIKSPVDLLVGACRHTGIESINSQTLQFLLRSLGQALFNPPNVAGWPGGKHWIDNATLTMRLNLPALFFHEIGKKRLQMDSRPDLGRLKQSVLLDHYDAVATLGDFLLSTDEWKSNPVLNRLIQHTSNNHQRLEHLIIGFMSTPEYQMC